MNIPSLYELFQERWGKFQTGWMISDTHFGDEDLRAGMPNRPSDEEIVKSINSKVGKNDLLIHMGDVGNIEYVRQLKGYKVLIMGNHDAGASNYKRQYAYKDYNQAWTLERAIADMRERYPGWKITYLQLSTGWIRCTADNCLFDEVYEGALMIGEKLMLSHEPVEIPWLFNIHGHNHQGNVKTSNHLNVCADVVGYEPVSLNKFLKEGHLSKIQTIHRACIDNAIERKKKRGGKKIRQK